MNRPLGIVPRGAEDQRISAGWLATPDVREWLREMRQCREQGRAVAAYALAGTMGDGSAAGILLVPEGAVPKFGPRVQPLAELLPGVLGPLGAVLDAGLLGEEQCRFFPYELHFFHPVLGVTGLEPENRLDPRHLLEMPGPRHGEWNRALPSAAVARTLKSIRIGEPPPPEEMLGNASGGIGNKAGDPIKEGAGPVDHAKMIGKGLAGGALLAGGWIAGKLGKAFPGGNAGAGKETGGPPADLPPNALIRWAEKNWEMLADRRNRELERLMRLMEKDPDEGLKFALPLAGTELPRGVAAPGWQLGRRSVNFSHGQGGGPQDGWSMEHGTRLNLERQYHLAAEREKQLGRHDRAAYIYGNLLGNWMLAARCLAEAGRHRDAAAIHLHKLHDPTAAARCLEGAGLLAEAAALYLQGGKHEKAGDLHAAMGNRAMALELWRSAVEAARDPVVKAGILSEKMDGHEEAIRVLDAAWRTGDRTAYCLEALYRILREQEMPERAQGLVPEILSMPVGGLSLSAKLNLMHERAQAWPEGGLWDVLVAEAYPRIGEQLSAGSVDAVALLGFLPKLDADDRLLARDAKRHRIRKAPPKAGPVGPPCGTLSPKKILDLPGGGKWYSMARTAQGVSIAMHGLDESNLIEWDGTACQSYKVPTGTGRSQGGISHLAMGEGKDGSRLIHLVRQHRIHHHVMDPRKAGRGEGIPHFRDVLAICSGGREGIEADDVALLQYTATSSLLVTFYSPAGVALRSFPIELAPPEVTGMEWRMGARGGDLCLAAQGFLAWRDAEGRFLSMNLGGAPAGLKLSPLAGVKEAVVSIPGEVLLVGPAKHGKSLETVNLHTDLSGSKVAPASCYLPDGSVVVAFKGGGLVFPPGDRVNPSATLVLPKGAGAPVDVCPSGQDGFAVVTSGGKLVVF